MMEWELPDLKKNYRNHQSIFFGKKKKPNYCDSVCKK